MCDSPLLWLVALFIAYKVIAGLMMARHLAYCEQACRNAPAGYGIKALIKHNGYWCSPVTGDAWIGNKMYVRRNEDDGSEHGIEMARSEDPNAFEILKPYFKMGAKPILVLPGQYYDKFSDGYSALEQAEIVKEL